MGKFLKIVLIIALFVISFIVFFPKDRLYYIILEKIQKYNVKIVSQNIKSTPFSLQIKGSDIYLSGAKIATVKNMTFGIDGSRIQEIKGYGSFSALLPHIQEVDIYYKTGRFATIKSDITTAYGYIKPDGFKIWIEIKINKKIKDRYPQVFSLFKKVGDRYIYEF